MKKRLITLIGAAILVLGMATAAFAAAPATTSASYGSCGGGYRLMWDQDGNFLDAEAFEDNLDKLIEDGFILAEDKDYYLERYEWCATYGGGSTRGCGRGMGRAMGCGW